ncbi:response regulator [Streptomyces chrestomyceticus JCM 4735]|uniref:Response regulator n=1 Tax=Streptomyces chrestomyceticus JCM 4735 TaxID=1306181 RepID=A0A7U9KPL6_9ACTN|nr:response regulator [Streptomyces chrestomyceticus]GCD32492.1 response regulator [Streptomyces chrestomyceticus JCM 4735]
MPEITSAVHHSAVQRRTADAPAPAPHALSIPVPSPAPEPSAPAAIRPGAAPGPERGGPVTVLLVDDRVENLLALEAVLAPLGYDLVRATSGEQALKALLVREFALILLDVQMPHMDGFETAAHIKRRARTRHVPIIFLTAASHGPHHAFRGYAAGASDYMVKPFDPWALRAKVNVFVDLYRVNRRLHDQRALLQAEGLLKTGELKAGDLSRSGGQTAASPVLAELDARLQTVEDSARDLFAQLPSPRAPAGAQATAAALAEQLMRLRQHIDLLLDGHALPGERCPGGPRTHT